MLCFAAITPHPPVLIPAIGKDQQPKVDVTNRALQMLEQDLYTANPQIIIIISPHTGLYEKSFAINAHTKFVSNFAEFGDLTTKREWRGAPDVAASIAHESRGNISIQLMSEERLDHGATVPLFYLTNHLPEVKILPVGYSQLSASDHMFFGELLKNTIMASDKRIAVVASGDLCHDIDGERGGEMKAFDLELQKCIQDRAIGNLLGLEAKREGKNECGYRSILILLGILKEMNYTFRTYAYEHPFGVGYLTGSFSF